MRRFKLFLYGLLLLHTAVAQNADWRTFYEMSGKVETPRYQATIDFCKKLAGGSDKITYTTFGRSAQGRELPLLILDRQGLSDPAAIHASGRIILLIQACIHVVGADGVIVESEAELLRAISDTLDCPMPPFVATSGQ